MKQKGTKIELGLRGLQHFLSPFFENNFAEFNVSQYVDEVSFSKPTVSKYLKLFREEGILNVLEKDNIFMKSHVYSPNVQGPFKDLNNMYWKQQVVDAGIIDAIHKLYSPQSIYLLKPISSMEMTKNSPLRIGLKNPEEEVAHSHYDSLIRRDIEIETLSDKVLLSLDDLFKL